MFGFRARTPTQGPTIETSCYGEIRQVKKYTYCGREYDSPHELERCEHLRVTEEVWRMINDLVFMPAFFGSNDSAGWVQLLGVKKVIQTRLEEVHDILSTAVEERKKITAARAYMENREKSDANL